MSHLCPARDLKVLALVFYQDGLKTTILDPQHFLDQRKRDARLIGYGGYLSEIISSITKHAENWNLNLLQFEI